MQLSKSSVKVVRHSPWLWNAVENIQRRKGLRQGSNGALLTGGDLGRECRHLDSLPRPKRGDGRPTHFGTQSYWGPHFGACENTSLQCSDLPSSWRVYTVPGQKRSI
jgi:hypothetical protein